LLRLRFQQRLVGGVLRKTRGAMGRSHSIHHRGNVIVIACKTLYYLFDRHLSIVSGGGFLAAQIRADGSGSRFGSDGSAEGSKGGGVVKHVYVFKVIF